MYNLTSRPGIASAIVSFWVAFYYNTIIGWCLYYLVQSFRSPLPWAACPTTQIGNTTVPVEECKVDITLISFIFFRGLVV